MTFVLKRQFTPSPTPRASKQPRWLAVLLVLGAITVFAATYGEGVTPAELFDFICRTDMRPTTASDETPFIQENDAAMSRMMRDMAAKPTGDVDASFTAMMIPHHQGAIDMALTELRYGKNEKLRRIAQEIIVEQQQEIAAMRLALGLPLPPSAAVQTQGLPEQPKPPGDASLPHTKPIK